MDTLTPGGIQLAVFDWLTCYQWPAGVRVETWCIDADSEACCFDCDKYGLCLIGNEIYCLTHAVIEVERRADYAMPRCVTIDVARPKDL